MVGDRNIEILQIDGLTMEPLGFSDLDSLGAIWADPEVTRFFHSRDVPILRENNVKNYNDFKISRLR